MMTHTCPVLSRKIVWCTACRIINECLAYIPLQQLAYKDACLKSPIIRLSQSIWVQIVLGTTVFASQPRNSIITELYLATYIWRLRLSARDHMLVRRRRKHCIIHLQLRGANHYLPLPRSGGLGVLTPANIWVSTLLYTSFSVFLEQKMWFLVKGFVERNVWNCI